MLSCRFIPRPALPARKKGLCATPPLSRKKIRDTACEISAASLDGLARRATEPAQFAAAAN
jgi:hypothetical protein